MATTNSVIKEEKTNQDRAPAAIETNTSKSDEQINPRLNPVSRIRRLDVDAVLARSLARVVGE